MVKPLLSLDTAESHCWHQKNIDTILFLGIPKDTRLETFEVMKTTSCNFHVKAPKIVATAQLTWNCRVKIAQDP